MSTKSGQAHFNYGPAVRTQLDFSGSEFLDASVFAFANVEVNVRFKSTQAGGPATVPFSILLRDRTDIVMSMDSSAFLQTSARFNMGLDNGQAIGFNHAYGAQGIAYPGPCTGNDCGFLTQLNGVVTANTDYTYNISVTAAFNGIISAPPGGLSASATVFLDPVISIDPNLEFAPGQKYVDYFEVELSSNVLQLIPEPNTASLLALGLGLMGFSASRRRNNDRRRLAE